MVDRVGIEVSQVLGPVGFSLSKLTGSVTNVHVCQHIPYKNFQTHSVSLSLSLFLKLRVELVSTLVDLLCESLDVR